jgi:hypothetical protein
MDKQAGVAAVGVVLILAIVVAGGAGIFAWQKMADSDRYQAEARTLRGELEKARADLRKATADAANATKEASQLKIASERLTAERDAVRNSMAAEQATGEQLRAELALAKNQVSYLSARTSKDIVRGMPTAPVSVKPAPR